MSPPHAAPRAPTQYAATQARNAGNSPVRAAILTIKQAEQSGELKRNRYAIWFEHQEVISILDASWNRRPAPLRQ